MSSMQEAIAKSVAQAISNSKPSEKTHLISTPSDQFWSSVESERNLAQGFRRSGKATQKCKYCFDGPAESPGGSKPLKIGKDQDKNTMRVSRKTEECSSAREEDKRAWKAIHRSKPDSYKTSSDSDSSSISGDEKSDSDSASNYSYISETPELISKSDEENIILDFNGKPLFDPDHIKHPRSAEWVPMAHLEYWLKKALDQAARNKLRAECHRPTLSKKVAQTPDLDPTIVQFLTKSGKNPNKGLDRSLKSCQDKLMDISGSVAKMFEHAKASGNPPSIDTLRG
ncbi:Hypothetical predicted protein [Pelobates cultripes]|uniref:Uncharacterized protein n=1 Tax=Pelobates cultripes TaxID=61616 RepID=A0AAD1RT29_PELCU|nr:Hypothetical predicted protein [Pelobates cultripes]